MATLKRFLALLILSSFLLTGCISLESLFFWRPTQDVKVKAEKQKQKDPTFDPDAPGSKQKAPGVKSKPPKSKG